MDITMHTIAHIRTDLPEKFGVPRQSGLVPQLQGTIVFEPDYRNPDALRGLESFSHLWLIFRFHRAEREGWSPTVRPPRLGGNRRMGVFATRSPFRPNNLGLSCVKLEGVSRDEKLGPVIRVSGADLVDGTPILDIKPYLPYADCPRDATGGFTDPLETEPLEVECDEALLAGLEAQQRAGLMGVLACDPRPRIDGPFAVPSESSLERGEALVVEFVVFHEWNGGGSRLHDIFVYDGFLLCLLVYDGAALAYYDSRREADRRRDYESEGELAYELALFAEAVLVMLEDFYVVVPESQGAAPDGGKHQELDVDVR